jgi:hypothetical protein
VKVKGEGEERNFAFAFGRLGDWEFWRFTPPDLRNSKSPSNERNTKENFANFANFA